MSIEDEALARAKEIYRPIYGDEYEPGPEWRAFVAGARWQASRNPEVTEDMVERGAAFLYEHGWRGLRKWGAGPSTGPSSEETRDSYRAKSRGFLTAALGGGGHE